LVNSTYLENLGELRNLKKLSKIKDCPICENWPNLVTLVRGLFFFKVSESEFSEVIETPRSGRVSKMLNSNLTIEARVTSLGEFSTIG
jgi:hypothetical protein